MQPGGGSSVPESLEDDQPRVAGESGLMDGPVLDYSGFGFEASAFLSWSPRPRSAQVTFSMSPLSRKASMSSSSVTGQCLLQTHEEGASDLLVHPAAQILLADVSALAIDVLVGPQALEVFLHVMLAFTCPSQPSALLSLA